MQYPANPIPSDLSYLPPAATGYGMWAPDEPYHPLHTFWLTHAQNLLTYFHQPDLSAVALSAAITLSHFLLDDKAVWAFLVGESSIGKTAYLINPLAAYDFTEVLSNITPKAFLSGANKGKNSFLTRTGPSKVWLFKDFTSILELSWEDRKTIIAHLREIHDGEISKQHGAENGNLRWKGKITVLAACTHELERYWSINRSLGERFLQIRILRPGPEGVLRASFYHAGKSSRITHSLAKGMKEWLSAAHSNWKREAPSYTVDGLPALRNPEHLTQPPPDLYEACIAAPMLLTKTRIAVTRHSEKRFATAVGYPEIPARAAKYFWTTALAHARLFGRIEPTAIDIRQAFRLVVDSIPLERRLILQALPANGDAMSHTDLRKRCREIVLSRDFTEAIDDLVLADVCTQTFNTQRDCLENYISVNPSIIKHLQAIRGALSPPESRLLKMPAW